MQSLVHHAFPRIAALVVLGVAVSGDVRAADPPVPLTPASAVAPNAAPLLIWPLRPAAGFPDPGYGHVSNFVDHDPGPGVTDYTCGDRTYDGHRGTDIALFPFPWIKMDADEIEVIAASEGVITEKTDGHHSASCGVGGKGNRIRVDHGDGTHAIYDHLKRGSLTDKEEGDAVDVGDYLGVVGSSGNSTAPHLHFEIVDDEGTVIDPFFEAAGCNETSEYERWKATKPYYASAINKITTTLPAIKFSPGCGLPAEVPEVDAFCPGALVSFYRFYVDWLPGQTAHSTIYDRDGEVFFEWDETPDELPWLEEAPFYPAIRARRSVQIPWIAAEGEWFYTVEFMDEVYTHEFTVADEDCAGPQCGTDADCTEGQLCIGQACVSGLCDDDGDCEPGEICDVGTLTCIPEPDDSTGTSGVDTDGGSDSGATTTGDDGGDETGDNAESSGGLGHEGDGCGACRAGEGTPANAPWLLLLALPVLRRRRA